MSSFDLDPFITPTADEFVNLFQPDIIHFLSKKIIKDFNQVDLNDLSHDFIAHFFSEGMLNRYRPDYNKARVAKIKRELAEKEKEFSILKRRNHQNKKDKRVLANLSKAVGKKHEKLRKCQEKIARPTRFKTYLFWCLRSYWWWHVVKAVDIYEDEFGIMREHIKTTPQPLLVSQIASDEDYKFSDVSNSVYQRAEEDAYRKDLRRRGALKYLNSFQKFLRGTNEMIALALGLLVAGMEISEVATEVQTSTEDILLSLKRYGNIFSKKIGNFGEYLEYC